MKLKEMVSMDVLKEFGFQLVEKSSQTGFQRYTKHYGIFLVTVCNNHLEKAIQITMQCDGQKAMEGNRIVASIHQINHDLVQMAQRGYLEETMPMQTAIENHKPVSNDWEAQMAANNPFGFLMES